MVDDSNLTQWVILWAVLAGVIVLSRLRRKEAGVGLVIAYIANLAVIHWFGAALYTLPWYTARPYNPTVIKDGFVQATYAVIGIGVGSLLGPFLLRLFRSPQAATIAQVPDPRLAKRYMLVGLTFYLYLMPIVESLPTLSALVSSAWQLLLIGLGLACWKAWQEGRLRVFSQWLAVISCLPFFTITTIGFLSYGTTAFLAVFSFIGSFYRPRWRLLLIAPVVAYLSLSFYVSYMRDRLAIREVVWGGNPLSARIERVYLTFSDIEWFDISDRVHLWSIDDRMNQNWLVGSAVYYLGSGYENFAYGETLWHALIALVPRAIWPEKPVFAGSMGYVTRYAGILFEYGTSVGIGQVMEFYVNFGTASVLLGFMTFGAIVALIDKVAAERLVRGDWQGFALWYLPGIHFLNVGGSLIEVTSGAGAAVVTVFLVNRVLQSKGNRK